jgi:hypothetical protein
MATNLNFSWREHPTRTVSQVSSLMGKSDHSDVRLYCNRRLFHAHKLVLMAASPYFESLFNELPSGQLPVVVIRNARPEVVELILTYIYTGTANVPSEIADAFLDLALDFELRGLEKKAQAALRSKIQKLVVQNGLGGATGVRTPGGSSEPAPVARKPEVRSVKP